MRHREKGWLHKWSVVKHRDFVNLEKFKEFGIELYERYNSFKDSKGEICELKNGKWIVLTEEEIKKLYEE